ncbi:MAG: aminoglycoside adenylyltransferase domain-containing protein [Chloroflexota bacterium]
MSILTHPTLYSDVNAVLSALLSDAQTILGERFIGLYLYGSLASGDFNPQTSDIDFVVVTADELPGETVSTLKAMHARLAASGLKGATRLEGDYIPLLALRRYDPTRASYPHLGVDGHFEVEQHGSDSVIQRHTLREQGVVVAGSSLQTLIDPVQLNDLRRAVLELLREWWLPQLHNPARLQSSEYQAYAVLTMCRALYTLQHGIVASKPVAARWAQEALDERWAGLIEQALAWRPDAQLDNLTETLDFIRHTLERSQQFEALIYEQAR